MSAELFKTVGMVAGIGGVALGVMLLVLRDIIKKNIFPKFKVEKNAYRLLRLIVISVWTVALLGIAAWVITSIVAGQQGDTITIHNNAYDTDMEFANFGVIVNQYQEIHGQPLPEELAADLRRAVNLLEGDQFAEAREEFQKVSETVNVPAVYNNVGGLYALQSDPQAARKEYSKAIALDPDYQATRLNLGLLEQSEGNYEQAERHLAKAESYSEARKLIRTMVEKRKAGAVEQEPNNDQFQPNIAPLDTAIQASINPAGDQDFYEISFPNTARDFAAIEVENQNLALKPAISLWDMDRKRLGGSDDNAYRVTPGQNVSHVFVAPPGAKYLVSVYSLGGQGPYSLRAVLRNAFDEFEPNEDLFQAKAIPVGSEVKASLLDVYDKDNYVVRLVGGSSTVLVILKNKAPSLKLHVGVYNSNRQLLGQSETNVYRITPGQDVSFEFQDDSGGEYFVAVASLGGGGEYILKVEEV